MAVMDYDGTISIYHDPENIGALHMSVHQERESKSKVDVECTTLDKFIDKPVDFLKMDIEGAETNVMNNLYEKGKLNLINQMVIEYHQHIKADQDNLSELLRQLEDSNFGYQLSANYDAPYKAREFQDIFIYAYQK